MGRRASDEVLEWVERIARYCAEQDGLPLIAGRILGWLTVCTPAEQSASQIAEAIGASRASLTTNLRLLSSVGFLSQVTRPGQRTVFYRVDDDGWARVVQRQVASLTSLGTILRDGLDLTGDTAENRSENPPESAARIRAAYEVFAWLERVFADAPPLPSGAKGTSERTATR